MDTAKPPPPPDSDSDEEFEELHALYSKRKSMGAAQDVPAPCSRRSSSPNTPGLKSHNRNPQAPSRGAHETNCAISLPSSPPMTKVYMPRTSDAGLGYFTEVEVTREEADRMVREDASVLSDRPRMPGGFRVWRQSEVPILDLTGED